MAPLARSRPQRTPLRIRSSRAPPGSARWVVEGNHDIIAEGTGVEPYTPWPPRGRPGLVGPRMGRRSSEMRRHRRTPGLSVFCAGRVMPDGPLDGGLPPEVLVIHAWLAVAMVVKGGGR